MDSPEDQRRFITTLQQAIRPPIVYVSSDSRTGEYLYDPNKLAAELAGLAIVKHDQSPEASLAYNKSVSKSFRMEDGAIAIFQKGINFKDSKDSKRLSQFSPDDYSDQPHVLLEDVRRELIWGQKLQYSSVPTDLSALVQIELQILRFNLKMDDAPPVTTAPEVIDSGYVTALEEEVQSLSNQVNQLRSENDAHVLDLMEALDQIEALQVVIAQSENGIPVERAPISINTNSPPQAHLEGLPKSVADVVSYFRSAYPHQLFFTDKALKSATNTHFTDVQEAWRIFYRMATVLHKLYFEEGSRVPSIQVPVEFKNLTGLDMAAKEGPVTNSNPAFAHLREDLYQGRKINISAHIKYGTRAPNLFRVHFYVDRINHIIVIGHAGDHLENGATRNQ